MRAWRGFQHIRSRSRGIMAAVTTLDDFNQVAGGDQYLCIVTTTRADGSVQASLVNAAVLAHPTTGEAVVGLVAGGGARKLVHLRARPRMTIVARNGWQWAAVEGPVELIGPDDPYPGVD